MTSLRLVPVGVTARGNGAAVGDQVVLGAPSGAVDRARPGCGPPFTALIDEESTAARDQSNAPATCNFTGGSSCNCGQTATSFQSRDRRQQVIPAP